MCSEHSKKALELHPNIAVFRHPDHVPTGEDFRSEIAESVQNFSEKSLQLAHVPEETFKVLYGVSKEIVLYWAHHEKLCLVDGNTAFMGGLDLCFGRWDTNSHPLADAHPTDISKALFPGQDFNNARVYDFEDVTNWEHNKLDRTKNGRMGWSDISICLRGPVVEDLKAHFVQRWNFIFEEKYGARKDPRYTAVTFNPTQIPEGYYQSDGKPVAHVSGSKSNGEQDSARGRGGYVEERAHHFHIPGSKHVLDKFRSRDTERYDEDQSGGGMSIQLLRSCAEWSNGVSKEVSVLSIKYRSPINKYSTLSKMPISISSIIASILFTLRTNSSSPQLEINKIQSKTRSARLSWNALSGPTKMGRSTK